MNFHESPVAVNVSPDWVQATMYVFNCKVGSVPFRYLGLLIGADYKKST